MVALWSIWTALGPRPEPWNLLSEENLGVAVEKTRTDEGVVSATVASFENATADVGFWVFVNLMVSCRGGAERTRSTLHMAKGLSTECRAQFGYAINHDPLVVSPIDWSTPKAMNAPGAVGSGIPNDSIEKFVWAVWQIEELRDVVKRLLLGEKAGAAAW